MRWGKSRRSEVAAESLAYRKGRKVALARSYLESEAGLPEHFS